MHPFTTFMMLFLTQELVYWTSFFHTGQPGVPHVLCIIGASAFTLLHYISLVNRDDLEIADMEAAAYKEEDKVA